MLRRLRLIAVVLMLLLGLAGIAIGFLGESVTGIRSGLTISMLSVFGASLFGASLTMLIEEVLGTEVKDIWQYLTARERFDSAPDYISAVVGVWHVYYVTKVGGERVWKSSTYVLTKGESGKSISGHFSVSNPHGQERTYVIEAGIRGDSLIAIARATEGKEADSVDVVPRITNTHLAAHIGTQMLETWDGEMALSTLIYSRMPIIHGDASVPENSISLDEFLLSTMKTQRIIDLRGVG